MPIINLYSIIIKPILYLESREYFFEPVESGEKSAQMERVIWDGAKERLFQSVCCYNVGNARNDEMLESTNPIDKWINRKLDWFHYLFEFDRKNAPTIEH